MAIFRKIHTSFWSDSFTSELDRDKKLFYLYLLTNERTTQCGIYEITKKQMCFDLLFSMDTVSKLIKYFEKTGKIQYNEQTKEIAIKNWLKYNGSTSPKVQSCVDKELRLVKDTVLIQYVKSMNIHPQEEEEQEQEEEEEKEKEKIFIEPENVFSFEEFWSLYPVKSDKAKSKLKYNNLKLKERQIIYLTLKDFISYKPFEKYNHPMATTYINGKRWIDELPKSEQVDIKNQKMIRYKRKDQLRVDSQEKFDYEMKHNPELIKFIEYV